MSTRGDARLVFHSYHKSYIVSHVSCHIISYPSCSIYQVDMQAKYPPAIKIPKELAHFDFIIITFSLTGYPLIMHTTNESKLLKDRVGRGEIRRH